VGYVCFEKLGEKYCIIIIFEGSGE